MKICKTCGQEKPISFFYLTQKEPIRYNSSCKLCCISKVKNRVELNRPESTSKLIAEIKKAPQKNASLLVASIKSGRLTLSDVRLIFKGRKGE